uniref:Proline dehydrogenase n=1 Tax=Angiostrongylus cantonensis TaxID=6313 RepID=A0A0K0DJ43_ANGCA
MGLRLLVIQRWAFARTIRSTSFATPQPKFEPTSPQLAQEIQQCYSKLDLSFENTKEVFKILFVLSVRVHGVLLLNENFNRSKSNSDILRALLVLRILAVESVVRHNQRILATLRATLGLSLFKKLLKRTFFGHFVAGEDRKEVESVAARLEQFGVKSILDYSVETDLSSEEAVKTTQISQLAAEVAPAAFTSTVDAETLQQTRQKYTVHKEFADRRKDVVSARRVAQMRAASAVSAHSFPITHLLKSFGVPPVLSR